MDVMANADVALATALGSQSGEGEAGQAKAPEASPKLEAAPQGSATTGTKAGESTTAKAPDPARPAAEEPADLPEEYKPFQSTITAKKWDPKSKEFVPTVLKSFAELEKAHTQSNQDRSLLNTRQSDFQRRLAGDPKEINAWRKMNGFAEIPVGKSYADQAKEKSELFTHVNNVFTQQDANGESLKWLNNHFGDIQNLNIKAGIEAERGSKPADVASQEFMGKAANIYTEHTARNPQDAEVFDKFVMPLFMPNGLMGSYGLSMAHPSMSPEHVQAWAKIGRALQQSENYDAAVKKGIEEGVEAAMEAKRKAGNAGSVGKGSKGSAPQEGGDFASALWASRHN